MENGETILLPQPLWEIQKLCLWDTNFSNLTHSWKNFPKHKFNLFVIRSEERPIVQVLVLSASLLLNILALIGVIKESLWLLAVLSVVQASAIIYFFYQGLYPSATVYLAWNGIIGIYSYWIWNIAHNSAGWHAKHKYPGQTTKIPVRQHIARVNYHAYTW